MRHVSATVVCLLALACASGPSRTESAKLTQPELQIIQLVGPADQNFPVGYIQVQYGVRIINRAGETLTLKRIDLEPMGGGGPYRLRRRSYPFNESIAPEQTYDFAFWANADSTGNWRSVDAYAPVTIRGVATFESPAGLVHKIFVKTLPQDRGRRGM